MLLDYHVQTEQPEVGQPNIYHAKLRLVEYDLLRSSVRDANNHKAITLLAASNPTSRVIAAP